MRLRHRSDIRTLAYAFVLMPGLVLFTLLVPKTVGFFLPLSLYAAYAAAVIAHNHNHTPTFRGRRTNALFSAWISIFYGFPTYGWIPTHNENHHKYRGAEGDATVRAVKGERDRLLRAVTHFFRSTTTQGPLLARHRARVHAVSRRAWIGIWLQYATVYGAHAAVLALACFLHGWRAGIVTYVVALGLPAFGALWGIMLTNWIQHVGCDPYAKRDHSRNFVAPWFNALTFDNGFHTVHHDKPGLHWSKLRDAHEKIAAEIDPALNVSSPLRYAWDAYVRPERSDRGSTPPSSAASSRPRRDLPSRSRGPTAVGS